jgi:ribonucleoside-diphosphate reductase alpha subunit
MFSDFFESLYINDIIQKVYYDILLQYKDIINNYINYSKNELFTKAAIKKLNSLYLLKNEDPQYMFMRTAIQVGNTIEEILDIYDELSNHNFIFSSPTLINSCKIKNQLASCFLVDTINNVTDFIRNLNDICNIAELNAGIGLNISKITDVIKYINILNSTAQLMKEKKISIYIEPHHYQIVEVIESQLHSKDISTHLSLALYVSDLFYKKVDVNEVWYLFNPDTCPELFNTYGEEFEKHYNNCVLQKKYHSFINAIDLLTIWTRVRIQTGKPYITFKDTTNIYNNQNNLGYIKSLNLCAEIVTYSDEYEIGVCNLMNVNLSNLVENDINNNKYFNFNKLEILSKKCVRYLNNVIDKTYYTNDKTKYSNFKNRPIGIGIQGLADCFIKLNQPFICEKSKILNKEISRILYISALEQSNELSKVHGHYQSYKNCLYDKGLYFKLNNIKISTKLNRSIKKYGLRNSLLIALMPTISVSHILSNSECFEPIKKLYTKYNDFAGEIVIFNRLLKNKLKEINLYNNNIINQIILNKGSIQNINEIPDDIKQLFLIAKEINQKDLIDYAADRQSYVDQSQSLNLYFSNNENLNNIAYLECYAWYKKLKTGAYYTECSPEIIASLAAVESIKNEKEDNYCFINNKDCLACQ